VRLDVSSPGIIRLKDGDEIPFGTKKRSNSVVALRPHFAIYNMLWLADYA